MSISAYVGLPRSGKSYSVVEVMIEAIKEGRTVYTNIPLNNDIWLDQLGAVPVFFDSQDIIDNPKWFDEVLPVGAMLVADECWRFWPSGLKTSNINPVHKEFLAMHGHKVNDHGVTTQIILVCQDLAQLAAFVRQLCDKTFRCTKLDALGQDKRFRVDIYQGAVTGQNPPAANRLREMFYKYEPKVFAFYKSASQSQAGDAGNEKRVDGRANLLKGNKFKLTVAGMVLFPIIAIALGLHVYRHFFPSVPVIKSEHASNQSVESQRQVALAKQLNDKNFSPLHGRKVYLSAQYDTGAGTHYIFKVTEGDNYARFTSIDLINAGYKIQSISECMVRIEGFGEVFFALCPGDKQPGMLAKAFQNGDETKTSM